MEHLRLRNQARTRGEFARIHLGAPSGDIPDEREARLVILEPQHSHTAKDQASPARREAAGILEYCGSNPWTYRNTLVFLAPDANRLTDLEQAVRPYLAWRSRAGSTPSWPDPAGPR